MDFFFFLLNFFLKIFYVLLEVFYLIAHTLFLLFHLLTQEFFLIFIASIFVSWFRCCSISAIFIQLRLSIYIFPLYLSFNFLKFILKLCIRLTISSFHGNFILFCHLFVFLSNYLWDLKLGLFSFPLCNLMSFSSYSILFISPY